MKKLTMLLCVVLLSAGLVFVSGCEDEPETIGEQLERNAEELEDEAEDASDALKKEAEKIQDQAEKTAEDLQSNAAIEQTVCPVMGGKINPALYVEYQGEKVYFCCAGCPETFEKNPQQYLSKLPQF